MKPWLLCILLGAVPVLSPGLAGAQDEGEQAQSSDEDSQDDQRSVRRLGDVIGEGSSDFSMGIPQLDMPAGPVAEQPDVTLPDPALDDQLQTILARRAFVPDNPEVEQELDALLDEVAARAAAALDSGDTALATRYLNVFVSLEQEDRPIVARIRDELARREEIERLLGLAAQALESGNIVEPADGSAWALYGQVLELDDGNEAALEGREAVREALLARADERLAEDNFEAAAMLLDAAAGIGVDETLIEQRQEAIAAARADRLRALANATRIAIDDGQFDQAEDNITQLIALGADAAQVARLRASLDDAIRYGGFEPGQLFQDRIAAGGGQQGPVMVVVPAGSFMMGSRENEQDRVDNEGPRFRVSFERGFALARTEVTVGQFRQFVEATGYVTDAERKGASRVYMASSGRVDERRRVTWEDNYLGDRADDTLPVVHVSWNDASAYAEWLAEQTDRAYRLPSEAEFEYALRAGSQSRYWWGNGSPEEPVENVTGDGDQFRNERSWTVAFRRYSDGFWGPAPVGSLAGNPFGMFDMGGNVMEWVRDCWHD
ncbi:MAG: formylglycine-generating enzyme family protein, partial [Wenzhouxiangellaceae bacterium]|nr:formylglycine-generating enzyme family protein [Wenzhouxiangellaceae bacterium]